MEGWYRYSSSGFRGLQHVAESAHRADQLRIAVVQLAAQVTDIGLDGRRIAGELVVPNVIQDLRFRDDAVTVLHQIAQQTELGRGERYLGISSPDAQRVFVH